MMYLYKQDLKMKRGRPPLPLGEGVLPNLWGLKVSLDSSVPARE